MESTNSASGEPQPTLETPTETKQELSDQWFSERFESLLPKIQQEWPDLAKQTLEATRGSLDEVIQVISKHSGKTTLGVQEQLEDIFNHASIKTKNIADNLEPLEKQLEELLDELNTTLRPKIEKPVRQRPLLAIGIATGIGVILGILLAGGRRD
tara:strand:+ start:391 stop:855 length:465 start_codon:yes stop_codon:yes gene_type:complete